jgi:hypothetical protein
VETSEVFFARGGIEFDFLGDRDGNFALLGGRRHGEVGNAVVCVGRLCELILRSCGSDAELENCCRDVGGRAGRAGLAEGTTAWTRGVSLQ